MTDLWPRVGENKYCTGHQLANRDAVENQKDCQDQCELVNDCVGITYSNRPGNSKYCYVCLNEELRDASNGFSFYKRQRNNYEPLIDINMNISINFSVFIKIYLLFNYNLKIWNIAKSDVIDGNWAEWAGWGSCSRSCGTGSRSRRRSCTSPAPSESGKDCIGLASQTENCNTRACPKPSK